MAGPLAATEAPARELQLSPARRASIRDEVERALFHHLGERVSRVSLGLSEPRLIRRGEAIELCFDKGEIGLAALDVGGIGVSGSVSFEDLRLDYGALGVGRFVLTADPSVRPQLSTTLAELQGFMDRQGLRDTFLRYDDSTGEIELGGRRPSRVLFLRVNPLVTVRGKFLVEDNVISFKISSVDVRDASGMVAGEAERRVRALASKTVDLDEVLSGLRVDRIRLAGGRIQVEADGGGVVFAQSIGADGPGAGD